jgi:hypothetical protein
VIDVISPPSTGLVCSAHPMTPSVSAHTCLILSQPSSHTPQVLRPSLDTSHGEQRLAAPRDLISMDVIPTHLISVAFPTKDWHNRMIPQKQTSE